MVSLFVHASNEGCLLTQPERGDHLRLGQHFRAQHVGQLLGAHQLAFEHDLGDATVAAVRLGGDFGGVGIADVGVERGDDADRAFDTGAQRVAVGGDAVDAVVGQRFAALAEVQHALEQAVGDDRLEGIQL
jgi:hypothetical protein